MRRVALPVVTVLMLTACAGTIPPFDPLPATPPAGPHVELQYLGSGGWLFRRGRDRIATAPFVSNPRWYALTFRSEPKTALIDRVVPDMQAVEIVLVGHGHYDHNMDLPHIARTQAPDATFYGGRTVRNQLVPGIDKLREIRAEETAVGEQRGIWIFNEARTVRFMAILSSHAPHVVGINLLPTAPVEEPLAVLPRTPASWSEGETLAFVIDFLGPDGRPEFRIYYQDAASKSGTGVLPRLEGPDAAPTDVAILCVAAFDQVPDNPEHILANVRPRAVIGGHWEDFFWRDFEDPLRPTGTSLVQFRDRTRAAVSGRVYLPRPLEKLYLPIGGP